MDCPSSARFTPFLASFLTEANAQPVLQYLAHLAARNYADTTLEGVVGALKCFLRYVAEDRRFVLRTDLTQTASTDITAFVNAAQQAGLASSTINNKLSLLDAFFAYLGEEGLMSRQPVQRRRHRLPTPLTLPKPMKDTDLAAFFKVMDSLRDRLLFLLLLRCGLRVSEACRLRWDELDLHDGTARINQGKGRVDRIVYFSPDVTTALLAWRAHRPPQTYLFPSRSHSRPHLSRYQVSVLMRQYLRAAHITQPYSPH